MSSVTTRPPAVESNGHGATSPGRGSSGGHQPDTGGGANTTRWMWTWITIGILVVLVVIGFLIAISSALSSINGNLAEADDAVTGAGGNVEPLPGQVEQVNGSLSSIDQELTAVPGQADEIIAGLTSVRDHLRSVDASLVNTSGTLQGTSGSLQDTSGVLVQVRDLASSIEATLEAAESPGDNLGASDIFERVATANGVLQSVKNDTGNVMPQLVSVNRHLESICEGVPTGAVQGGSEC